MLHASTMCRCLIMFLTNTSGLCEWTLPIWMCQARVYWRDPYETERVFHGCPNLFWLNCPISSLNVRVNSRISISSVRTVAIPWPGCCCFVTIGYEQLDNSDQTLLSFKFGLHGSHEPTGPRAKWYYKERMKDAFAEAAALLNWSDASFARNVEYQWILIKEWSDCYHSLT